MFGIPFKVVESTMTSASVTPVFKPELIIEFVRKLENCYSAV